MEKDIMKLLEYLQEIIDTGNKIPLTGRVAIEKKEANETIEQIINYLPDEFKKAQWVLEEKQRILNEATTKASLMEKAGEEAMKRKIENSDITKAANDRAAEIIALAQKEAKLIRRGTREYADNLLTELNKEIGIYGQSMVEGIKKEVEEFVNKLQCEVNTNSQNIKENVKELRDMK